MRQPLSLIEIIGIKCSNEWLAQVLFLDDFINKTNSLEYLRLLNLPLIINLHWPFGKYFSLDEPKIYAIFNDNYEIIAQFDPAISILASKFSLYTYWIFATEPQISLSGFSSSLSYIKIRLRWQQYQMRNERKSKFTSVPPRFLNAGAEAES